jgi:hypothetical protein
MNDEMIELEETRVLSGLDGQELAHVSLGLSRFVGFRLEKMVRDGEAFYFLINEERLGMVVPGDLTLKEVWKSAEIFEEALAEREADRVAVTYNFMKAVEAPDAAVKRGWLFNRNGRAKRLPNQPFYRGLKRYSK